MFNFFVGGGEWVKQNRTKIDKGGSKNRNPIFRVFKKKNIHNFF